MTSQVSKEEKSKQEKKSRALELRQRARAEGLPRKTLVEVGRKARIIFRVLIDVLLLGH